MEEIVTTYEALSDALRDGAKELASIVASHLRAVVSIQDAGEPETTILPPPAPPRIVRTGPRARPRLCLPDGPLTVDATTKRLKGRIAVQDDTEQRFGRLWITLAWYRQGEGPDTAEALAVQETGGGYEPYGPERPGLDCIISGISAPDLPPGVYTLWVVGQCFDGSIDWTDGLALHFDIAL